MTDQSETTKQDIRRRLVALKREDDARRTAALRAISEQTRPAFKAIESECGETGHEWKFDHWNFTREYAWDKCIWCCALEGAEKHPVAVDPEPDQSAPQ
jgi:hypothetical protein